MFTQISQIYTDYHGGNTTDNGGVSAESAGYAGGAEGRHDDDEAGRLADDEAGGDCHEHPEPGDEGRREGGAVHPEHSDAGEDHEEEVTTRLGSAAWPVDAAGGWQGAGGLNVSKLSIWTRKK